MQIQYVGPFEDGVFVDGLGDVPKGEPVDCPADLAKGLLEQPDNWQPVSKKKGA